MPLDRPDVPRRREVIDDCVEDGLDALVPQGRAAKDRKHRRGSGCLPDTVLYLLLVRFDPLQVFVHECIVMLGYRFKERLPVAAGFLPVFFRDIGLSYLRPQFVRPHVRLHGDEVNDAAVAVLESQRHLERQRHRVELLPDHRRGTARNRRPPGPSCSRSRCAGYDSGPPAATRFPTAARHRRHRRTPRWPNRAP